MTVGLVIVSHSARLALGVVELVGQMSQGKTPLAAAGGGEGDILGTSVEKILAAIQAVDGPDGVLVLLDLGSAILAAEMALEMLEVEQQARIRLSYAPLVEGSVAAALEASLGHTLVEVKRAAEKTASEGQLRRFKPLSQEQEGPAAEVPRQEVDSTTIAAIQIAAAAPDAPVMPESAEVQLILTNLTGLHARPASLFVQTAGRFQASIQALVHGRQANAASILQVLALGARQGDTLTLRASGVDARLAVEELSELVRANFHEAPGEP